MTRFTYHCSQEQFTPSDLLGWSNWRAGRVRRCIHLRPRPSLVRDPGAGRVRLVLAGRRDGANEPADLRRDQRARRLALQPALLAQATGTLGQMFPGRLPWIALGSGQLLNEHVTGEAWPDKAHRNARLREGATIMRALLAGETVTHRGLVTTVDAKVWSRPDTPTLLMGAATTAETAAWCGAWADGLLTVNPDLHALAGLIEAFRGGGGAGKPLHLKVDISWAPSLDEALHEAHRQWRFNALGSGVNWDIRMPEDFDVATRFVREEDMRQSVMVVSDLAALRDWLAERVALGFETINLHNVGRNQAAFIDAVGSRCSGTG